MSVLERFKTLPTVNDVTAAGTIPADAAAFARDTITLGWEDRLRTRGRRTTDGGIEFGIALPRGTVLRQGDCLIVTPLRLIVTVVELAEPVLVVCPRTPEDWGLVGYYIGNSHQPVMLTAEGLVCPDILGVRMILEQHRLAFIEDV
ncbi:MAG: urease accessory protein UreE, partial [Vicinamibacterales bacterium]